MVDCSVEGCPIVSPHRHYEMTLPINFLDPELDDAADDDYDDFEPADED